MILPPGIDLATMIRFAVTRGRRVLMVESPGQGWQCSIERRDRPGAYAVGVDADPVNALLKTISQL